MALGWGVAIPIGVLIARTLKDKDPLWFQIHRGANMCGLLVALAAWVISLAKFGPLNVGASGDGAASAHTVIGMAVMILGVLQPINALMRPHKGDANRWIFNWVHWTAGRLAWAGGIANVALGIALFRQRDGRCSPDWPIVLYAVWLGAYAIAWAALEVRKLRIRPQSRETPEKAVAQEIHVVPSPKTSWTGDGSSDTKGPPSVSAVIPNKK